jgi:outer membrane protein TolC
LPLQLIEPNEPPSIAVSLVQCLEVAAQRRPEIGVAREAVTVAQHGVEAAVAEFRPRVYVLASVGAVDGLEVQSGYQEGAGLHLNQPLFAGGRRRGELRAAEADVAEAIANAQSLLDNISLEVTLAHRSLVAAQARIDLARPAIDEARENLRLVRTKYRNGNATPTDVIDAETALTRAQQRYWSATFESFAALARLRYAMGEPQSDSVTPSPLQELPVPFSRESV